MRRRINEIREAEPEIFFKMTSQGALTLREKAHLSEVLSIPPSTVDLILKDYARFWTHTNEDRAFAEKLAAFSKNIDKKVMYLPTYRRIEKDLKLIIPDIEEKIRGEISSRRETEKYIELVEFGMDDIVRIIDKFINLMSFNSLNEYNLLSKSYLQEIIRGQISSIAIPTVKSTDVQKIADLGGEIGLDTKDIHEITKTAHKLSDNKKKGTASQKISEGEKYVMRYVVKLLEVSQKLEQFEVPFRDFIKLCNSYLDGKQCEYDKKARKFSIKPNAGNTVSLKNLSSGEKQIISLFCHLNLGSSNDYLVIIDEPELSLSVEWQKKLLPDIVNTKRCSFLAAVTPHPSSFPTSWKNIPSTWRTLRLPPYCYKMGKHLKNLKAASKESVAVSFYYSRMKKHSPASLFLFFEGDEDPSFYNPRIREIFGNGVELHSCICNGRVGVLDVLKKIKKKYGAVDDALFFVDRDFTSFTREPTPRSKLLYVTDGYSIENAVVSTDAFEIVLVDLLKLNLAANPLAPLVSTYNKLTEEFERGIAAQMALLIFSKKVSTPNFQNLDLKDLLSLVGTGSGASINWKAGAAEILRNIQVDATLYNWKGHLECFREVKRAHPCNYVRGKYALSFFLSIIQIIQSMIVAQGSYSGSRRIMKTAVTATMLFDALAPRLATPPSLKAFLAKSRRAFRSSLKTSPTYSA